MSAEDLQLAEFLLDAGLLSRSQLQSAFERSDGKPLRTSLVESGYIGEDELRRATAGALGIPFVTLQHGDVSPEALQLLPEPFCRLHNIVGARLRGDVLEVALLDIADAEALQSLDIRPPVKEIAPRLTDRASMKRALIQYQKLLKEKHGDSIQRALGAQQYGALVDALIRHALHQGASDAHLEERAQGLLVRYRLGGTLHEAMVLPKAALGGLFGRLKALAQLPLHFIAAQEGRFKVTVPNETVGVRVSVLPLSEGEKIVLHFAREQADRRGFTLQSLGFHGENLETLHRALSQKRGLIVVAGPEHSGKTTLLYTLLDLASAPERNAASIEEKIEHRFSHASQAQTSEEVGFGYAAGLRALLRQDADVILVGDVRDEDTAALAVRAASRGKLVLAGMTAPSAAAALGQLLGFGVDSALLASSLNAAVTTSLVRALCPRKEQYLPARAELRPLEEHADFVSTLAALKEERACAPDAAWKDIVFYRPESCPDCDDGYRGALGIQEVISNTATVTEELRRASAAEEMERAARADGAPSLLEDAICKAAQGRTSIEEVFSLAGR